MRSALVALSALVFAGAAHAAQPCTEIVSAHYNLLSPGDQSVITSVMQNDNASAFANDGGPLAATYHDLANAGYMQAIKADLPPPQIAFEWAKNGRKTCAGFTPPPAPPPPPPKVWSGPQVAVTTTMGDITIVLDTVGAPKASENFLKYVKSGHFVGAAIYRIEPGFVVQLGDLDAAGKYRAPKFPAIPLETANTHHERGAVAFAHADDPNSAQSTWYFDLAANTGLNAKPGAPPNTTGFAVFGHVTTGMDVIDKIAGVELKPTGGPFPGHLPKTPILVTKIEVKP